MKTTEFCYWLQGLFELQPDTLTKGLTPEQTTLVKRHLALVFQHDIDPSYTSDPKKQAEMQAIHDGVKKRPPLIPPTDPGWGGESPVFRC